MIVALSIVLAIAAFLLSRGSGSGTIREDLKDFEVTDTASVTRIFLADKEEHSVTLERNKFGVWMVNNRYEAREDAIHTLLETIRNLRVKAPVGKAAYNTVIKQLASRSVKIEIYSDDEKLKVYYVGGETPDQLGTYMMLENAKRPFVMYIPGFDGYLSTRYFAKSDDWRSREIFNLEPRAITNIRLESPHTPENSWELTHDLTQQKFELKALASGKVYEEKDLDMDMVEQYFFHFRKVNYEAPATQLDPAFIDSVISSTPLNVLTITDLEGKTYSIKTFLRPANGKLDGEGNPLPYDVDRLYGLIHDNKDFVLIQYFVFDKILLPMQEFLKKEKEVS